MDLKSDKIENLQTRIAGLQQTIDEKDREIERLHGIENRYNAIFENTGAGTILVDEDTTMIMANKRFIDILGYPKDQVEGKSWTEFIHKTDVGMMKKYHDMRRIDSKSAPKNYIFRLMAKGDD